MEQVFPWRVLNINRKFKMKEIIIRMKGKKKPIGRVKDDKFITQRDPDKHVLHSHNAVGISTKVINRLFTMGVKTVVMSVGERTFTAPLDAWRNSSFVRDFEDEQKFVTIDALENDNHQLSLAEFGTVDGEFKEILDTFK